MGCGGSRTDVLEPRYMESWTKETESTWLTSTDTDIPLSSIQSIPSENSSEVGFPSEKTANLDLFDDGLPTPAQAYLKVCSAMSEVGLNDMKTGSTPAILSSQEQDVLSSSATTVQRRSVLRTEEITKWQDNRMSTKQVTITVTQSIRQVDKSGKIKETSQTTYELMKPVDGLMATAIDSVPQ
ncbi:brain and acute leukemia cytoplasmic protein [Danio rerio]|uniref:BAALC binder of MAP3K1 and KLF4 b n=1 Tax=Danio rerio TaxID=7955 RepID=E7F5E6_DANRE|nr:brain and acute leukemia cytoplasmic protein [Danio rerio]|eukprot:XP_003200739.1 brain and acute leukemia cytoplasmic protein [Danio rerio]